MHRYQRHKESRPLVDNFPRLWVSGPFHPLRTDHGGGLDWVAFRHIAGLLFRQPDYGGLFVRELPAPVGVDPPAAPPLPAKLGEIAGEFVFRAAFL